MSFVSALESAFKEGETIAGDVVSFLSQGGNVITDLVDAEQKFVANNGAALIDGVQTLISTVETGAEEIIEGAEAVVNAGKAFIAKIESIFETTAAAGPGGTATP